MVNAVLMAITYGLVLGIVHYYSEQFVHSLKIHKMKIISFGAGISISYIFLVLLPELYQGVNYIEQLLFVYILIGFVMFHILERYLYQHEKRTHLMKELKEAHSITFFIYHFIIGIVLTKIAENLIEGLLFFIPILFYTALSQESLNEIHKTMTERQIVRLFLSASTLFGVFFELTAKVPLTVFYSLIGFISGALLYIVIRESIPKEKKGRPSWFVFGVFVYITLIFLYWFFAR